MKFTFQNIIIVVFLFTFSVMVGQEDLEKKVILQKEQQQINFETFFFEALQQKAIENYDKAIYALEECQVIEEDNLAVLFELSKNHYLLNQYDEAEFYGLKALQLDVENLYLLRHLKEINLKKNDVVQAVKFQREIIKHRPEEEVDLIYIYIRGNDIQNAKAVLKKLSDQDKLPDSFSSLKESLLQDRKDLKPVITKEAPVSNKLDQLKRNYKKSNSYTDLKAVLERELKTKEYNLLLEDSELAIELYPSQPYVYLINAKALINFRKYQDAIDVLEMGTEFVVDDVELEADFMEHLSLCYKGLGKNKIASDYYSKMQKLRDK